MIYVISHYITNDTYNEIALLNTNIYNIIKVHNQISINNKVGQFNSQSLTYLINHKELDMNTVKSIWFYCAKNNNNIMESLIDNQQFDIHINKNFTCIYTAIYYLLRNNNYKLTTIILNKYDIENAIYKLAIRINPKYGSLGTH
jgi:hypothetical protein